MKKSSPPIIIAWVFIGSLVLNIVLAFTKMNDVWANNFITLLVTILGIYAVHLALIFSRVFAARQEKVVVQRPLFLMAFLLCCLWNLLITVRMLKFAFVREDNVKLVIEYLTTIALASSFLVVGVLSYFFEKQKNE